MNKSSLRGLLPLTFGLIALLAPCAFAQETTAGIQGTVKDPSGGVVANATVEVSSPALIGTKTAHSDSGGAYRFAALPPGVYEMTTTAPGFRTSREKGIDLSAGRLPTIEVQLQVGAVAETVDVSGAAPIVDVTQSKVAVTVEREILDNIPKGRSFQSVIPFAAGARQEPLQSGTSNRDNGFQIDGATDSENVYLIDGVNTTNIQNGGVGKNFQTEFIEEVQIKSSSFEAEYGGAIGGVINAVPKRGSNDWHGSVLSYLRTNALNANDACGSGYTSGGVGTFAGFSTTCGLRLNPATSLSTAKRLDGTPEYYVPKKDHRTILEPGYTVGGALLKNRLWLFSAYVPTLDTIRRTTTFTGANPGPRTLTSSYTQHNAYNRLDYGALSTLRLFGSWNYAYSRTTGQLGQPDSAYGQVNAGATTDPNTLRADAGSVNPSSVYTFGGDWTPTSRLVVSVRYGYFFNNNEQRGTPVGTRFVYQSTVNAASKDLAGNAFPASSFNQTSFANIPTNLATAYDAYKRNGLNADVSYFVGRLLGGSHTFKGGYFWQRQSNDVLTNFQGGRVDLYWGQSYTPVTSNTACDSIIAANQAAYGQPACQGKYGYFVVGTGVTNTGADKQYAQALYFQDSWNVGHGLTLNVGLRLDEERQPPYDPKRFPTVEFGWGQKIAPRIGGAYDVLHNGKVKLYASYGKFYDIMKMGLARGSFGSDYWHNCVYAIDDTNYAAITPSYPQGGGCPATGVAPGVTVGRFIENVDFRATKADTRDPAISPNMKPMLQHEVVMGVDWAITANWSLETRYARKRLDRTIEDMAITDNLGFYIGNPGSTIADVLHRPTVIPDANGANYLNTVPFCAECPPVVPAIRRYDGLEFRLSNRATGKWFGSMSYTYSHLTGNYAGLTNTDPTDGGGGRHAPDNGRAFDIPTMTYLPSGKIDDGPLSTDRPNTGKVFGFYRQKWFGQETMVGFIQSAFQGTPIGTCLPVVGTSSACQWAEGRGNFVKLSRAADGTIVKDGVVQNARTDNYIQTDFSLRHEIRVGEGKRLSFEGNITNLFNQRAGVAYYQFAIPANLISPTRAPRFSGDPGIDWGKVMNGYNYVDALNGTGAFSGVQAPTTLASRYGLPQVFQGARNMRLAVRFVF
ncbi:MAG: TonB-dependent receptor, plug [Bryobacterales bacterium]|nr:TonB-dependent receptor, plug [Bryobacterales bacterium]